MATSRENAGDKASRSACIGRRLRVIVPCLLIGMAFCFWFVLPDRTELYWWTLAGPFAEPWAVINPDWLFATIHAAIVIAVMSAHPIWPNPVTACVTILASGWWFLMGLGLVFAGV